MAVLIPLSKGLFAKVSPEDAPDLLQFNWRVNGSASRGFYAVRSLGQRGIEIMHRRITQPGPGLVVDHINGDTLDNQRSNLRNVTASENKRNVSGARGDNRLGVLGVRQTPDGKYMARIMLHGKSTCLGTFLTLEGAKQARLAAEKTLHGVQPRRAHLHG